MCIRDRAYTNQNIGNTVDQSVGSTAGGTHVPPGTYNLHVYSRRINSAGTWKLVSNSVSHDLYADMAPFGNDPENYYAHADFGQVTQTAADSQLDIQFECVGKNAASSGYTLTLDYYILEPV